MNRRKYAFLVSVWVETGDEERDMRQWRGSVEHLATKRRFYFSEIAELVDFLALWIGRPHVK